MLSAMAAFVVSPRQFWVPMKEFRIEFVRRRIQLGTLLLLGALLPFSTLFAQAVEKGVGGTDPHRYSESSAEHAALLAAAKHMKDVDFSLRQEYWKGDIKAAAGKAVKLQFFPHTEYRLFFAAPATVPKGTKVHLKIVNRDSEVLASTSSRFGSKVVALKFKPKKTGLYLVLMRLEVPKGTAEDYAAACAMFYGYE